MKLDSYLQATKSLQSLILSIGTKISSVIIKKCVEGLQAVRGITATYRMTNKEMPTKASFYVENILLPLKQIHNDLALVPQYRELWEKEIISSVNDK